MSTQDVGCDFTNRVAALLDEGCGKGCCSGGPGFEKFVVALVYSSVQRAVSSEAGWLGDSCGEKFGGSVVHAVARLAAGVSRDSRRGVDVSEVFASGDGRCAEGGETPKVRSEEDCGAASSGMGFVGDRGRDGEQSGIVGVDGSGVVGARFAAGGQSAGSRSVVGGTRDGTTGDGSAAVDRGAVGGTTGGSWAKVAAGSARRAVFGAGRAEKSRDASSAVDGVRASSTHGASGFGVGTPSGEECSESSDCGGSSVAGGSSEEEERRLRNKSRRERRKRAMEALKKEVTVLRDKEPVAKARDELKQLSVEKELLAKRLAVADLRRRVSQSELYSQSGHYERLGQIKLNKTKAEFNKWQDEAAKKSLQDEIDGLRTTLEKTQSELSSYKQQVRELGNKFKLRGFSADGMRKLNYKEMQGMSLRPYDAYGLRDNDFPLQLQRLFGGKDYTEQPLY